MCNSFLQQWTMWLPLSSIYLPNDYLSLQVINCPLLPPSLPTLPHEWSLLLVQDLILHTGLPLLSPTQIFFSPLLHSETFGLDCCYCCHFMMDVLLLHIDSLHPLQALSSDFLHVHFLHHTQTWTPWGRSLFISNPKPCTHRCLPYFSSPKDLC